MLARTLMLGLERSLQTMALVVASLSNVFSDAEVQSFLRPLNARVLRVPPPPQPKAVLVDAVADADLVIAGGHHDVDAEVIGAMRRCRLIQFPGAGVDTIDLG